MSEPSFNMKNILFYLLTLALLPTLRAEDFNETVKVILARTQAAKPLAIQGQDVNWFFLRKELEHLAKGDLAAADMSKANIEATDPLPVIAKYKDDLRALGVELLLVPIPAKAAIYPEKLSDKIDPKTVPSMSAFFAKLKAAGVEVLDLESVFKAERLSHPEKQLYCATDSHWSPYAAQLTAKLVADKYKGLKEISENSLADLIALPEETIEFYGDLIEAAQKASVPKEKLPLQRAGKAVPPDYRNNDGTNVYTLENDPNSAMLVIGDSHLQVFRRGGNMITTQAGFIDHLQIDLPTAVEEITMQAGGADGPRVEVARATAKNPDFWTKKKVVVWIFTAREFTVGKWRVLPVKVVKK